MTSSTCATHRMRARRWPSGSRPNGRRGTAPAAKANPFANLSNRFAPASKTAEPAGLKPGRRIDVRVSTIGDAKSLFGGERKSLSPFFRVEYVDTQYDVSSGFDEYWNTRESIPIEFLKRKSQGAAIEDMVDDAWYAPFRGGLSVYGPKPHRGPFVHVDTRGSRARW